MQTLLHTLPTHSLQPRVDTFHSSFALWRSWLTPRLIRNREYNHLTSFSRWIIEYNPPTQLEEFTRMVQHMVAEFGLYRASVLYTNQKRGYGPNSVFFDQLPENESLFSLNAKREYWFSDGLRENPEYFRVALEAVGYLQKRKGKFTERKEMISTMNNTKNIPLQF